MRRLLHALLASVLLVAGLGLGWNLRPAAEAHACCGGDPGPMPPRGPMAPMAPMAPMGPMGPMGDGCPCPQPPTAPGPAHAPLLAPVSLEAATQEAAEPARAETVLERASAAAAPPAWASTPARAPALHRRLALLRCWRT